MQHLAAADIMKEVKCKINLQFDWNNTSVHEWKEKKIKKKSLMVGKTKNFSLYNSYNKHATQLKCGY